MPRGPDLAVNLRGAEVSSSSPRRTTPRGLRGLSSVLGLAAPGFGGLKRREVSVGSVLRPRGLGAGTKPSPPGTSNSPSVWAAGRRERATFGRALSSSSRLSKITPTWSRRTRRRISSTSPSANVPIWKGPYETRIRRFTCRPIASIARRISRFLPSRRPMVSHALAPCWRSSETDIGWKVSPSVVMPSRRGAKVSSVGRPLMRTRYLRSQPVEGSSRRRFRSPSLVSSKRPSELMSSLPMDITRGISAGSLSKIVARPSSSLAVVTRPVGL